MNTAITKPAMDALLHALGYQEPTSERRNRYVTNQTDPAALELVAAGLFYPGREMSILHADDRCFLATEAGKAAAAAEWKRRQDAKPKIAAHKRRAKSRYDAWLSVADACPDLTFGDYLRRGCQP